MSEGNTGSPERAWYQNGEVVFGVVAVCIFVYVVLQQGMKQKVVPQITGRIENPLVGEPSIVIQVWHHHPGILRNGKLIVSLKGKLAGAKSWKCHSFEEWEPNENNAFSLLVPMQYYDPKEEITVVIDLTGKDIQPSKSKHCWLGEGWKVTQETNGEGTGK